MALDVDMEQLKHAYLIVAMLFLTFVLLTEHTSWNLIVVTITLAGHAYLAIKLRTLQYLRAIWDGTLFREREFVYSLVPIPRARIPASSQPLESPRQPTKKIEQSQMMQKTIFDRRSNLREIIPSDSRSKSSVHQENTSIWKQQKIEPTNEKTDIQTDIHDLRIAHTKTLNSEKIPQHQYIQSIGRLVSYLSMWIDQLSKQHQKNIRQINRITCNYFNLQLCLTDIIVNDPTQPPYITVDEMMNAAVCLRTMGCLKWKWARQLTIPQQVDVLAQFSQLSVERTTLDNFLAPGQDSHNWREKCIRRLVTLAADLEPSKYGPTVIKQLPLKNVTDRQLFFSFFRTTIDRLMVPNTSNVSPIRVRRQETSKFIKDGLVYFLTQLRDTGLQHTDIAFQDVAYHCQPGDNNMLSAFYFYFYVLKVKLSHVLSSQSELQKIIRFVVI